MLPAYLLEGRLRAVLTRYSSSRELTVRLFSAALLLVLAAPGCYRVGRGHNTVPATTLFPAAILRLLSPVACLAPSGTDLLAAEESGERILVFNRVLQPRETLALTRRLVVPRGLAADRYYVYVYDDNTLYRYSRSRQELEIWLTNLRVAGMAGYAPAEVLVSDARRGIVWRKGFFGESRMFLDATDIARPTSLAELEEGMFAILGAAGQVIVVNRAGIAERRLAVGREFDRMTSDRRGRLIFYRADSRLVLVTGAGRQEWFELDGVTRITDMAVWADGLVVLDGPSRFVAYDLPSW